MRNEVEQAFTGVMQSVESDLGKAIGYKAPCAKKLAQDREDFAKLSTGSKTVKSIDDIKEMMLRLSKAGK